jgi:hypothetical protein
LIVMGSRELKREKEYVAGNLKLLGSVARRVSESAGFLRNDIEVTITILELSLMILITQRVINSNIPLHTNI